jgi:hypothetical protein
MRSSRSGLVFYFLCLTQFLAPAKGQNPVSNPATPPKTTPTITWPTPAAISYGTALSATQLNATASATGTFVYSSVLGTVLPAGSHTLTVTFTPSDTTSYNPATAQVTITVKRASPTITWPPPAAISFGTVLSGTQLNATANAPGTFVYTPAAGTAPAVGSQTLSTIFTPTDAASYDTATSTVTLAVNKSTPSITWAAPQAIIAGTPLSSAQLDATANVAGKFEYKPTAGTVLLAGSQPLTTTFTPTDSATYSSATSSVTLAVDSPASVCSKTSAAWPNAKNPITAVIPGSIYEGTVTIVRLTGSGLDTTWTMQLCPVPPPSVSAGDEPTNSPDPSSATALSTLVTAKPGSAGQYKLMIFDSTASAAYDSGQTLTIAPSSDVKYVACAGPASMPKPNANLGCSFVPLSYETAYEVFGKGVADRFVAVQVTVENRNSSSEFLLQDVRVGKKGFVLSSYDKKIPRSVGERAEQLSARAIVIRVTAATASVLTGIAGIAGNVLLTDAAIIYAGPAQTGLQSVIPNFSAAELARIDDLGFSVTSTVIPKSTAIAVVAFAPSDTLHIAPHAPKRHLGLLRPKENNFSTYKGPDLEELFASLMVSVAGTHVQATNPSQPTLKLFIPSSANTITLAALQSQAGPGSITVQGTSLDGVSQIQLTLSTDSKAVISAKLQPLQGETSVDPTVALLSIPTSSNAASGDYNITFILKDGTTVNTSQKITVLPTPVINPPHAKASTAAAPVTVAITGKGFGESPGTVTFSGATAEPIDAKSWTDTSITAAVPSNVKPGPVTITSSSNVTQTTASFTVDQ